MEEELYRKLDEDGGKKMIFKMAWDRTEDGRDVKRGAVIKGITTGGSSQKVRKCRAPELGLERGGSVGDTTGRSGNSNAQDEKRQGDRGK